MEDKEEARGKIEEIKRRLKKIEEKTGKKIDLNKVLGVLFTKENLKKGTNKIILALDKMLKEDMKEYIETGSLEKGPIKIEHGFRLRFLGDGEDKSHINWIKKNKRK